MTVDMTQTVLWDGETQKYRFEYLFEDAPLLGEILVSGASQCHLQRVERVAVHLVLYVGAPKIDGGFYWHPNEDGTVSMAQD